MDLENLQSSIVGSFSDHPDIFFTPTPDLSLRTMYCTFLRRYPDRKKVGHSDVYHLVLHSRSIANVLRYFLSGPCFLICKKQYQKKTCSAYFKGHTLPKL